MPIQLPPPASPTTTTSPAPSAMTPNSPEIVDLASRLFQAAREGSLPIFEQALPHGLPPNLSNAKGDTLLMLASYHGHLPLAQLLLQHGADPNRLNDRGQSPLAGCVFKQEAQLADLLIQHGADVDLGRPSARETVAMFRMNEDWTKRIDTTASV